ncbi:MAG: hypothetical protein QG656_1098 [Candidatus Hydrogenedentes bacterium]|nr:hypothetical protein [Candidatus Hydrogenedentota bacterium]
MNRNKALTGLAPSDFVLVEANALGSLFCGETFKFILDPCTRRAAERIARWHGCRFQFHESTGCGSFVKRDRVTGFAFALVEAAVQRMERLAQGQAHAVGGTPA